MKAILETSVSALCPECGEGRFPILHEFGRYGPWGCDQCGSRYEFDIAADGVEMTKQEGSDTPGWLIVKVTGSEPPIYMVKSHTFYASSAVGTQEEADSNARFWVEENTCPTNIVPVEAIVWDGDPDPHGVLEFVAHVPAANWREEEPEEGWVAFIENAVAHDTLP